MKKYYHLLVLALAIFASCKKSALTKEDNGCISRISRNYADSNKTELAAALKLLKDNHIATSNMVVSRVILNDTIGSNGPVHVFQHVVVQLYANGLPILFGQAGYHFNGGVYNSTSGYLYGAVSLDTLPHTRLPQLRYLFTEAVKKDAYSISQKMLDSCLVAEFGYYDVGTSSHGQLIKAWRVTPANSLYPVAIIQDNNTKLLSYFNGLLTFNKKPE